MGHLILIFFVLFFIACLQTVPFLYLSPRLDREVAEGFFFKSFARRLVWTVLQDHINYTTRRDLVQHSLHFVLSTVLSTYTSTNNRKGKLVHPLNTRAFTRTVAVYRVQTGFPLSSKLTLYYDHVLLKLGNDAHVPH